MQTGIMYKRVDILSLSLILFFFFPYSHSFIPPPIRVLHLYLFLKFLCTVVFESMKLIKNKTLDKRHHHHYYCYYQVRVCVLYEELHSMVHYSNQDL